MPTKPMLLIILMSSWPGGHALAAGPDCRDPVDQTTMNICADRDYQASDTKLNAAYRRLAETVSPVGLGQLKAAQRAWIAYRDAQCAFETAGTADGSVHSMIVSLCLDRLTQEQTGRLEAQSNCEEGDLSCGRQ